jgi:O-antigen/teichoic acid export membrane protein
MSSVRVTYSGLISFAVSLIGLITGTLFVVIVTRRLSPEEFGLWTLIGSMVVYVGIAQPIISYWSTRQLARGENVGKTTFFTGTVFSFFSFISFSIIALFVSFQLGVDLDILLLASFLVPIGFLGQILNGISLSFKPQTISYGLLIFEVIKVPLGFIFVVIFDLGIIGAIITTLVASSFRLSFLIYFIRDKISGSIEKHIIKFWLKMSWLPLYNSLPGMLSSLDVLIFSFFSNSLIGLAYWGIANTISNKIGTVEGISQGLYPKLLSTKNQEIVKQNLERTMFFGIPFLGLSIVLAKPLLFILNPIYADGFLIVIILSIRAFIGTILSIFLSILRGYEGVDMDKTATFKQYVKSKLFFIPTITFAITATYLIFLTSYLFLKSEDVVDVILVTHWSIIYLAVYIPFTIFIFIIVKQNYKISFPIIHILKYSLTTFFASIIVYLLVENYITYEVSIWKFLPQLIPIILAGGMIYFVLTYIIDHSTRDLLKSILNEIKIRDNHE